LHNNQSCGIWSNNVVIEVECDRLYLWKKAFCHQILKYTEIIVRTQKKAPDMRKIIIGIMGPGANATAIDLENAAQLGKLIALSGWVQIQILTRVGVKFE